MSLVPGQSYNNLMLEYPGMELGYYLKDANKDIQFLHLEQKYLFNASFFKRMGEQIN
jgi:hypothetical protein